MRFLKTSSVLLSVMALALTGCGSDKKPVAIPVSGKVLFKKDKPAVGALVVFHPKDPQYEKLVGGKPHGKVKDDGTFVLTTYAEGDGAPEGEYGVTVEWRAAPKGGFTIGEGGGGNLLVKPTYANPQQPFLTVTVKKGEANNFNLDVD
jgi:hypothetical protein